jgi:hypothetical protein
MSRLPNLNLINKVLEVLESQKARLTYQLPIIEKLLQEPMSVLKMARQTGKTYLVSVIVTCYVLLGLRTIICLPTFKQGSRLLFRQVKRNIKRLKKYYPTLLQELTDNQDELLLKNGGQVVVLSSNKDATSREGYGAHLLVIDEAHNSEPELLTDVEPFLTIAAEDNEAKAILIGVGGNVDSLIEKAVEERGYKEILVTGYDVARLYPKYQNSLDRFRETLSPEGFEQMVLCKQSVPGGTLIFDSLPREYDTAYFGVPYAGIDVGYSRDPSVVTIMYAYPKDVFVVTDTLEIRQESWENQAFKIVEFLRKHKVPERHTMIEKNSIGVALIEAMYKYSYGYNYKDINNNKKWLVDALRYLARKNSLIIKDDKSFNKLVNLYMYPKIVDGREKIEYQHSDYLSSLIMAYCNIAY